MTAYSKEQSSVNTGYQCKKLLGKMEALYDSDPIKYIDVKPNTHTYNIVLEAL